MRHIYTYEVHTHTHINTHTHTRTHTRGVCGGLYTYIYTHRIQEAHNKRLFEVQVEFAQLKGEVLEVRHVLRPKQKGGFRVKAYCKYLKGEVLDVLLMCC